ncbi:MAG: DEAD/DEAH box helicase [Pseudomonadota bacterium]
MNSPLGSAALRQALPRTWGALLARHGTPNAVQRAAAGPLLAGRDVLITAPTASGKTEAYLAPLCERLFPPGEGGEAARLLIVSPTRALANDLFRRIAPPLGQAGIGCGRWTGDHHDGGRLHPVTLVTPEALDSRLARDRGALAEVRAVVLDELHAMDRTVRGDQLRLLLERLRVAGALQVAAASATVADPHAMAGRYLRDPVLVGAGERRSVHARIVEAEGPVAVHAELAREVARGFRKVLAFCKSREEVEVYARLLRDRPPFRGAVFAHHGDVARSQRLATEQQLHARPVALCLATSTLELGIDIGDVDLVALVGPPSSVSSLQQRVGRGGRRGGGNAALCLAAGPWQARVFRTLLEAQAAGELLEDPSFFRPSVLIQQAISLLHENPGRWIDAPALRRRLPSELAAAWPEQRLAAVLAAAAKARWLQGPGPRYALGEQGEVHWVRGGLHANLAEDRSLEVRDALTGDHIGHICTVDTEAVGLAGRARRVLAVEGGRVLTAPADSPELATFGRGSRALVSAALAARLVVSLGLRPPVLVRGRHLALLHGLGSAGGALLGRVFRHAGMKPGFAGPLALILPAEFALAPEGEPLPWPGPERVPPALRRYHRSLGRRLALGRFHRDLPEEEQILAVEAASGVAAVASCLAACPPPVVEADDLLEEALWWS